MQNATVLVVGSGGREHALAWSLARSPQVKQVYVAPGNAGTAWEAAPPIVPAAAENVPLAASDIPALLAFARDHSIDLTVVGPEAVLAQGIVDEFQAAGLRIFGPTRAAAQLESSKAFAKAFMREHAIATADYAVFDSHEAASRHLDALQQQAGTAPLSVVVKADGLAAGKGVSVCHSLEEAQDALQRMMVAREFGAAGERVVIEERLRGREVSLMAFCDGHTVVPMLSARDHKPVFDGDQGPNTGGMGVYAPAPDVSPTEVEKLLQTVLQPVVSGMAAHGTPYVGVLYAGLMLTNSGVSVLEFNCRFGDPETQVVLPLLATSEESGGDSLFAILLACTEQRLAQVAVRWQEAACAAVVLASAGYPGSYATGAPISGLVPPSPTDDVIVFHAGTAHKEGQIVTAGGRVLSVAATGDDLATALQNVYASVQLICFEGMHYRRDIGQRELQP